MQKLMQARRTAADEPAGNDEPDLGKGRYESPTHPDPSKDKEVRYSYADTIWILMLLQSYVLKPVRQLKDCLKYDEL